MRLERVLVTGTTSGIGRALLEHYAARGVQVISVNRRRVAELEARHPSVRFECVDVRSAPAVERLIDDLAARRELPDVFILNAGINRVDNDESFELAAFNDVLETNLYGVLNFVRPITCLPAGSTPRHVLAISSLASYAGNPYGLGYYASKRALTACFDVWARMYADTDLIFQQVMLGPVPTSIFTMAEQLPPWMVRIRNVFSASPANAARAISRFAETSRRKLFYPWPALPLFLGMGLCQSLLPGFFQGQRTLAGRPRRRADEHRNPGRHG
jgi:NAD(P)-dependent dehydrogenase (short-subunit alcohol dehydrogenase family)